MARAAVGEPPKRPSAVELDIDLVSTTAVLLQNILIVISHMSNSACNNGCASAPCRPLPRSRSSPPNPKYR